MGLVLMTTNDTITHMTPVGLGGYLTFTPRLRLDDDQMENLREAFVERTRAEGAQNGKVVFDWFCNNSDGPPYTQREVVMLYCDGDDSEEPTAVLYRTGQADGLPASLHVPPAEWGDRFGKMGYRLWDNLLDLPTNMTLLNGYLSTVINDPDAWQPFDINRDPFAVEED